MQHTLLIVLGSVLVLLSYLPALLLPMPKEQNNVTYRDVSAYLWMTALAYAAVRFLATSSAAIYLLGIFLLVLTPPLMQGITGRYSSRIYFSFANTLIFIKLCLGGFALSRHGLAVALFSWTAAWMVCSICALPSRAILFWRWERRHGRADRFGKFVSLVCARYLAQERTGYARIIHGLFSLALVRMMPRLAEDSRTHATAVIAPPSSPPVTVVDAPAESLPLRVGRS